LKPLFVLNNNLHIIYNYCIKKDANIETAFYDIIPEELVLLKENLYVGGFLSGGSEIYD